MGRTQARVSRPKVTADGAHQGAARAAEISATCSAGRACESGLITEFKLSKIVFREKALAGELPGLSLFQREDVLLYYTSYFLALDGPDNLKIIFFPKMEH
ncbi:hypothetical protein HK100_005136 [Physocladia obscura]|uniref:Uncharacterized protein n=1 Tax=Physocladia obscura TaxID=109957 RepID=A0AAD5SU94_9FUNG|nr:hypothetical protein HK100_005136 [Physocladia obscura]